MKINVFVLKTIVLIGFYINDVDGQNLNIGDSCTVEATQAAGHCKLLTNCKKATDDLRLKKVYPTNCGVYNLQPVVCCPIVVTPNPSQINITQAHKDLLRYKKCVEYSSTVYENVTVVSLIDGTTKKTDRCGLTSIPLIQPGLYVRSKEFPHSAALGYKNLEENIVWLCGGSLVSNRYVLTAAHCTNARDFGEVKYARLGDLDLLTNTDDTKPEEFDIERIIRHPQYTLASTYNDIALLRLNKTVTFNAYIRPICLPFNGEEPKKVIESGWDTLNWGDRGSKSLLKSYVEIYEQPECNNSVGVFRKLNKGIVGETQICAGLRHGSRDETCQLDSGGPLQFYHPDVYCMYIQIGVSSFSSGCGSIDSVKVYTRVFNYVDWIENVIWPNGDDE